MIYRSLYVFPIAEKTACGNEERSDAFQMQPASHSS